VQRYVSLRNRLHGDTYVTVSIIDQPKAQHEIAEFQQFWSRIVEDVVLRRFHDFMGAATDKEQITLPARAPCRCLWSRFNVNSEGIVSVCFNDWDGKSVLGDLNNETIQSIWQHDVYRDLRQSHLVGKPKGICANCNDWIGASWVNPYEVLKEKAKQWRRKMPLQASQQNTLQEIASAGDAIKDPMGDVHASFMGKKYTRFDV
jgi:hypothetical protein